MERRTNEEKIEESKARDVTRSKRSAEEQLVMLDSRLGKNQGAKKERERLNREIGNEKTRA